MDETDDLAGIYVIVSTTTPLTGARISLDAFVAGTARERVAKVDISDRRPASDAALKMAAALSRKSYDRAAQIRRGYFARPSKEDPEPPLVRILRSGRGNATRLKLHLTFLWLGSGPGHRLYGSASSWARLLDLDDPTKNGARAIRSAFQWLENNRLVEVEQMAGRGLVVTLLSETGDGERYVVAGKAAKEAKEANEERTGRSNAYVKLPHTLWTLGWLHVLSPPALAMLLVLIDAGASGGEATWFSPRVATNRYVLSEETRGKGLGELSAFGIITTSAVLLPGRELDSPRMRSVHRLHLTRLSEPPLPVHTGSEPADPTTPSDEHKGKGRARA